MHIESESSMKEKDINSKSIYISAVMDDHDVTEHQRQQEMLDIDIKTKPVQCTEDLPNEGYTEAEHSDTNVVYDLGSELLQISENIDLAVNEASIQLQGFEDGLSDCIPDVSYVEEDESVSSGRKRLDTVMKFEEHDEKTMPKSDFQNENVDSCPLEIKQYLKHPFRPQHQPQIVNVYMLHKPLPPDSAAGKQLTKVLPFPKDCHVEWNRLATFIQFPPTCPVYAVKLAKDGFVYRPECEAVDCNFCRLRIYLHEFNEPGRNPTQMHQDRCPDCPLKRGVLCGNKPVPKLEELLPSFPQIDSTFLPVAQNADTKQQAEVNVETVNESYGNAALGQVGDGMNELGRQTEVSQANRSEISSPMTQRHSSLGNTVVTDSAPVTNQPAQSTKRAGKKSSSNSSLRQNKSGTPQTTAPNGRKSRSSNSSVSTSSANISRANSQPTPPHRNSSRGNVPGSDGRNTSNNGNNTENDDESSGLKTTMSYSQLGICSEKPKRSDMAVKQKRLNSFAGKWKDTQTQTPEMLASAGMFYAGYSDCARCFFCGGGLKNWDPPDEPWIEHARWFPKCGFLRMTKGPMFVEIVQRKNKNKESIKLTEVEAEIEQRTEYMHTQNVNPPEGAGISSAGENTLQGAASNTGRGAATNSQSIKDLTAENEDLRLQLTCKICMDHESSVVFLPCGHLVACTECAIAMKNCPLCRADIKGSARAHMS